MNALLKQILRAYIFLSILTGLGACSPPNSTVPARTAFPASIKTPTSPAPTALTSAPATFTVPASALSSHPAGDTPDAPSTVTRTCLEATGHIADHSLSTDLLPQPIDMRIFLPPCYDQEPERRYPVLYLIHGQYFTHDQWDRLGALALASRLIAVGELPPFLIVMPRDRRWTRPERDPFGQALVEAVVPWIDATYRTIPERGYRAIGGLSRGAAWAVHLGLTHWDLFGALGIHSPPVFWTDIPLLPGWLDSIPAEARPRIFIDIGDKDSELSQAVWFEELLDERAFPHEWYLFPGYHEEAYWQAHLEQYLRWYTAGW